MRPISLLLAAASCLATASTSEAAPLFRATAMGSRSMWNLNDRGDVLVHIDYGGRFGHDWLNGDVIGHGFGPRAGHESKLV
jgi:hypothetical protein